MRNQLLLGFMALALWACNTSTPNAPAPPIVGGDQDEHGCKGSAGYTWSAIKGECIRIFESGVRLDPKAPGLDQSLSAFVVFKSDTSDAQAEVFLPGNKAGLLFAKMPDNGAGTWALDTFTLTQWKGMYTLEGKSKTILYQGAAKTN